MPSESLSNIGLSSSTVLRGTPSSVAGRSFSPSCTVLHGTPAARVNDTHSSSNFAPSLYHYGQLLDPRQPDCTHIWGYLSPPGRVWSPALNFGRPPVRHRFLPFKTLGVPPHHFRHPLTLLDSWEPWGRLRVRHFPSIHPMMLPRTSTVQHHLRARTPMMLSMTCPPHPLLSSMTRLWRIPMTTTSL